MSAHGFTVVTKEWTKATPEHAWDVIVPCDLPSFFPGMKPAVPAITEVTDQTGAWDAAGQSRTIHLADGGSTHEEIDAVDRPRAFNYTVGPFKGPTGKMVEHAKGEFVFEEMAGGTLVRWTYVWKPRPGMQPVVWVLAKVWSAYSKRVLAALAKAAEPAE